jgi:DNA-binding NarL/FixJ family response regulator
LKTSVRRILVVEDSEPFRKFVCLTIGKRPEWQIVGEVADGLEAVQTAEQLRPDLILLDIGLPSLNGIEVARRIRRLPTDSKILFVSLESSAEIVEEAFDTGAHGYVVKTDAGAELLEAVDAVLRGKKFVGERFSGHHFICASRAAGAQVLQSEEGYAQLPENTGIAHRHNMASYSGD